MSKKLLFNELLFNEGGDKVPVLNKYTGTESNYPIEINSELLDEEEKTYIEEIEGNTLQGQEIILSTQEIVNAIHSLNIGNVLWEILDNGKARCVKAGGYYAKNIINYATQNNSYIQLTPNTKYSFIVYGKFSNTRSYIVSDTAELAFLKSYDDDREITIWNFTTDASGKIAIYFVTEDSVSDPTKCVDMKLVLGDGIEEPYESDLSDIRSVGDTPLDEVYEIEIVQATCPYEFGKGGRL